MVDSRGSWLTVLGLMAASAGCTGGNPPSVEPGGFSAFVQAEGMILDTVYASSGDVGAVAISQDGGPRLFAVIGAPGGSIGWLLEPVEEGVFTPQEVRWTQLGDDIGLLYKAEYPSEGVVETVVYMLKEDRMALKYADPPFVCHAASLEDLDGDGVEELLAYIDEVGPVGACEEPLMSLPRELLGFPAAWVEVRRWAGDAWVPAKAGYGAFYRRLEEVYGRMLLWVDEVCPDDQTGDPIMCSRVDGFGFRARLADMARRARTLAALDGA